MVCGFEFDLHLGRLHNSKQREWLEKRDYRILIFEEANWKPSVIGLGAEISTTISGIIDFMKSCQGNA